MSTLVSEHKSVSGYLERIKYEHSTNTAYYMRVRPWTSDVDLAWLVNNDFVIRPCGEDLTKSQLEEIEKRLRFYKNCSRHLSLTRDYIEFLPKK